MLLYRNISNLTLSLQPIIKSLFPYQMLLLSVTHKIFMWKSEPPIFYEWGWTNRTRKPTEVAPNVAAVMFNDHNHSTMSLTSDFSVCTLYWHPWRLQTKWMIPGTNDSGTWRGGSWMLNVSESGRTFGYWRRTQHIITCGNRLKPTISEAICRII